MGQTYGRGYGMDIRKEIWDGHLEGDMGWMYGWRYGTDIQKDGQGGREETAVLFWRRR